MSWMSEEEREIVRAQLMADDARRRKADAENDWRTLAEGALAARIPGARVLSVGRIVRTGAFVRVRGGLACPSIPDASWFSLILEEDGAGWAIRDLTIKLLGGGNA